MQFSILAILSALSFTFAMTEETQATEKSATKTSMSMATPYGNYTTINGTRYGNYSFPTNGTNTNNTKGVSSGAISMNAGIAAGVAVMLLA